MSLSQEQPASPPMDDAEAQMRRALGLAGDMPRSRPENGERSESPQRQGGNFMQGAHRRRFVQDGEIPVTVVRRDEASGAVTPMGPSFSRLHRVETALQTETAARERAERTLQEAQAALQALRTKIGHNELAKNEAIEAARRDRAILAGLREEMTALTERLRETEARVTETEESLGLARDDLAEERMARQKAERLLRENTRQASLALDVEDPGVGDRTPSRYAPRRGRSPDAPAVSAQPPETEEDAAEPVKWWLMPAKPVGKRR